MRLDSYLTEKKFFDTRTKAKEAISRGEILLNGKVIFKASYEVDVGIDYDIKKICKTEYVSNGGYKLEKALTNFNFSPYGLICADIGASTGGFTDCLLQNGAKKVYAVDLNDTLLHEKLKNNPSVIQLVDNAKNLTKTSFFDRIDLIVADLSFISATMVLPVFENILIDDGYLLLLIKPQFEIGEKRKFKNGIVNDKKLRLDACQNIIDSAIKHNLFPHNITTAPVKDKKNIEYLILCQKNNKIDFNFSNYDLI